MNLSVYIFLCLIWGSTWLAIKIGLSDAEPFTTAAVRFAIASLIMSAIVFFQGRKYPTSIKGWLKLGEPGIYIYGISYILVYLAEQHISSSLTAVLYGSFPFFIALISSLKYKSDQLSKMALLGMLIGFLGVVIISYDSLQLSDDIFMGTVMVVTASFASAWGVVLHKQKYSDVSITVAVNVQMIMGTIILVIGMLIFEDVSSLTFSLKTTASIVYLALFGTVLTFLGYYWLLKRMSIITLSLIALIIPVVAIILGVPLAGETFGLPAIFGTAMILSGVFFVARESGKK